MPYTGDLQVKKAENHCFRGLGKEHSMDFKWLFYSAFFWSFLDHDSPWSLLLFLLYGKELRKHPSVEHHNFEEIK